MEEQRETGGDADSQESRGGIRYITEELLMKLAGCSSLALVRSLNLSSFTGDKRFKFIENLHGCQRLQILNLNHNLIQRMERLNCLTHLRELQLAHNNIQRIEGLELMSSLQHLNLSYNRIDHIPVWLGKKLQSLHTLHLQHNLITSKKVELEDVGVDPATSHMLSERSTIGANSPLYEVSRLRSLSSLSEFSVSGNPASSLQHSRLFLLFHLRTLERLDDLPITQEERGHAHKRFSTEELERLQRQGDSSQSELSRLQREQQLALTRLHQQEETNRALTAEKETQRHAHTLQEQELHTKSQLLEKTTSELTRAFHRLYELEQECTFYKLDSKLNHLPSCSVQGDDSVDPVAESPYIGKARHIGNTWPSSSSSLQTQEEDVHTDMEPLRPLLEGCRTEQRKGEADRQSVHHTEQQPATEQPGETNTHRQQEALCCLLSNLSVLEQLTDGQMDGQMDGQTEDSRTERETEELQTQLLSLEPTDLQHAHVTTRLASCRQMLDTMSRTKSELEDRLDDMLSRIAMETQEITELEQQLTDGQILANEALQRDLEGIISGLQEYLRGLREQARRAQQQVVCLQAENQSLQLHLEDTQRHCRQLEAAARTHRQDMSVQQAELSVLRMEAQALRDRQVDGSRQQVELEAELQQLRAELTRQVTLGQLECGSLQAAVDKEKQIGEIRESQLQSTIDMLQDEKSSLQQVIHRLQAKLDQTRTQFKDVRTHLDRSRMQMDQITAALLDSEKVLIGPGEPDEDQCSSARPEDMWSRSLEQLYRVIRQTKTSREQLQHDHKHSQEQVAKLQDQVDRHLDHITQLEAQQEDQDQDSDWRLKEELQRLRVRLQKSQSRNRHIQHKLEEDLQQSRLQLRDVQQERDALLQQLRSQSDIHQRSLGRLDGKLRQLSRSMCDSDQLTAEQLKTTTEQLRALNHTVQLLHTHTLQNSVDEPDGSFHQHTPTLQSGHTHTELRVEQEEAHTHTPRPRTRSRTRIGNRSRTRDGGQWCFIPAGHSAPSLGSLGTQDSGLGLQYVRSPEGGRRQDRPPTGGGYWVYIPPTCSDSDAAAAQWRDSGGDSDRSSRGHTPPPPPPAAAAVSAGLSAVQTPLVGPALLLYSPPAGGAALHCNIPEHRETQADRCECVAKEAERLEEKKKKLRLDTKQLRRSLRRHRSVMQVCEEVECVEKTLLKRRAELRRADRLLLEARSCIHTTRDKADVLQQTAQDGATCLLEATQHLRELQEEVEELRRGRQEEEQTLREVEEELRSRNQELQELSTKIHSATHRLSVVLSDCQDSQKHLDSLNSQVEQQQQELVQRREEHQTAENRVMEVREEEQRLQSSVKELLEQQEVLWSQRRSTVSDLREQQQISVQCDVNTHRAELKRVLQELLVEQRALEEVKTKRSQSLQQLHKKKNQLERIQDEVDRMKDELERKQEELDWMRNKFDGTRGEVEQKEDELEQKQQEVERMKQELDKMQQEVERKRKEVTELQQEVESNRKEAEVCQNEMKQQRAELQQQQEELSRRREERSRMEEQCKHLEARRKHADRCLSAVEAELAKKREEHSCAQLLKQEVVRDTAATQEQLHENSELLCLLSEQVEERKKHLQILQQELSVCSQQQQQRVDQLKEVDTQAVCVGLDEVKAAVSQLEDRRRHLTQQELQLTQIKEELLQREKQLIHRQEELQVKEEELRVKEEELLVKEEELRVKEEGLPVKEEELHVREEELKHKEEDSREEEEDEEECFYLSTAGLSSVFSTEEERWAVELQTEELRQQEDRLKARLRCSLWNQQENQEVRRLEAEETLQGLKLRLDQLDSLLTHTHTHTLVSDS